MGKIRTYKISSSVKVEQLEAELSSQLQALRSEMEKKENEHGTSTKPYSSVHIPKDVSYFRMERQQVLQRELQVAGAKQIVSQSEIIQRELESCLGQEYTPESLPLLLHQVVKKSSSDSAGREYDTFFTDRSYQLAQFKYQLMLRWRRFCRHSIVLEQLYPEFKEHMTHLTNEFEDAKQRAHRLAVSRERFLLGADSTISLVLQEDVVIYLQWLICHLHSVKMIHSFLHREEDRISVPDFSSPGQFSGIFGSGSKAPLHSVKLDEFQTELQHLLSYYNIQYNTESIKTSADQMELFSLVNHKFRTIFKFQEEMSSFLQYDSTEAIDKKWGRKSPNMALRKEANWTSHIQVKPKRNPWQQKQMSKMKEMRRVDEFLQMHSRSCESDVHKATQVLKQHAAFVFEPESMTSKLTTASTAANIWRSIFNIADLSQESTAKIPDLSKEKKQKGETQKLCDVSSAQLLGLDEDLEDGSEDPVASRGAYMSLLYLRHIRIKELRRTCLSMLNYLRSLEKRLAVDTGGLQVVGGAQMSSAEESGWMNAARGGSGSAGGLGSQYFIFNTPADYKVHCTEFMEFPEVENLSDYYSTESHYIHVQDQRGLYIMYDAALMDLNELEDTLLLIASHYIGRNRETYSGSLKPEEVFLAEKHVDRMAVLLDVWTCETAFLEHKIELMNCYFDAYQHVIDLEERFSLAQVITDIMHRRPHVDLEAGYFVQAYRQEVACLQTHQQLIKSVLNSQIDKQRQYLDRIWRGEQSKSCPQQYGFPLNYVPKQLVSVGGCSPALKSVYLLELHPSLSLASGVYRALEQAHAELCELHGFKSDSHISRLEHSILKQALFHWHTMPTSGASYSPQIQRDLYSEVFIEDPDLVRDLGLSVLRSAEEQGRGKQTLAVEMFYKLLELVTIRHRIIESASETEHLSRLYKSLSQEMGFDEHHLYMRSVQFEFAAKKEIPKQPLFITTVLQDSSCVDRFCPSSLPLAIQELDENHIGKFSFRSEEAVLNLMNQSSLQNLHVVLACQVTQKNALLGALKQALFCYWAESSAESSQVQEALTQTAARGTSCTKARLADAFVSIQLKKVGPRDE
ncbi:uncharacterized protein si:ch73-242m19.1, partial [Hoplias malabaricus]|uniref:uncharacterized protein si:ch73-242m19.1 n=1 Tax=Hoplias malabaricus TaxID=27720 RepID=UPI003462BD2C